MRLIRPEAARVGKRNIEHTYERHVMPACVVPGGSPWADDDSERFVWVIVIVLVMSLVASGSPGADHALEVLSLIMALLHRER